VPQFDTLVWAPEIGKFVTPLYLYGKQGVTDPLVLRPGDKVVYSSDGIGFNNVDLPLNLRGLWKAITWSPQLGLLVCVSEKLVEDPVGTPVTAAIMTAFNVDAAVGSTWTGIPYAQTQGLTQRYRCITWAPEYGMFLVVGYAVGVSNKILYSFDGITWTLKSVPASPSAPLENFQVRNIVYSREISDFILCADGPSNVPPPLQYSAGYMFNSSNIFKLPAPNNVFNSCFNRTDEEGNWGMGSAGASPMPASGGVVTKTGGYFSVPAGGLGANTLPAPLTLGNGLDVGYAPMFFDTTANKLYIYNFVSDTWKSTTLA
jgi:hypothetical protein